jgi:hypothetical protein
VKKAKAPRRAKLPLNSGNWWPLNDAYRHRRSQTGSSDFAITDLQLALESGDLPSKLRQQTITGKRRRETLFKTPKFWREGVELVRRGEGVRLIFRSEAARRSLAPILGPPWETVVYVWKPAYEELWPTEVPTPRLHEGQSRPGSADAWIDFLFPNGEWRLMTPKQVHKVIANYAKERGWKEYPSYSAVAAALSKPRKRQT